MKEYDFSFRDIVEYAKDVVVVTKASPINEPGPEIVYVNKAFTELTGYSLAEVEGKSPRILQSDETDVNEKAKIRHALAHQSPVRVTLKNFSKFGDAYWLDLSILPLKNANGEVSHFVAIERDVTEQKDFELQLEVLTRTDHLTKILNRRAFYETSAQEFQRFKRKGTEYAMLMVDIDHFKQINDQYGHTIGDEAIKTIAKLCQEHSRSYDTVARMGGEEFCLLLPETDKETSYIIAEKLRKMIEAYTLKTAAGDIKMTVSIGVSVVKESDKEHSSIFQRVDKRMHEAKESSRNCVC